ncbi:Interleukin-18-binding protein, partial [Monkeypox virus]
GGGIKED